MKKICYCVIGIINIKIIMQINSQNASKKIWFLFSLWSMIIIDIVSLRKKFLLITIAEIGIIITLGHCFKYVSTNSERGREKRMCWLFVCVISLRICITYYYIHFQAVFNLESLVSSRKLYLKQITQLCSTKNLQYLILEFDSEQLTWGQ